MSWKEDAARSLYNSRKTERRTQEACESLRFLVYGTAGTEGLRNGPTAFWEQRIGTKEEITKLHQIWVKMDEDGSGDVEFDEFLSFFSKSKSDRLLGMRCVNYLVGNATDGDEDKATGCTIEDMLQLMWLKATKEDIDQMMNWFTESQFEMERVPTPPLLTKKKRREIIENFPFHDFSRGGISFQELLESGLADPATAKELWTTYAGDDHPKVRLSEARLLEMLCPNGYRAHPAVQSAVGRDGQQLVLTSNEFFKGWTEQAPSRASRFSRRRSSFAG